MRRVRLLSVVGLSAPCDAAVVKEGEGDEWRSLGVAGIWAGASAVVHVRRQTRITLARKAGETMLARENSAGVQ